MTAPRDMTTQLVALRAQAVAAETALDDAMEATYELLGRIPLLHNAIIDQDDATARWEWEFCPDRLAYMRSLLVRRWRAGDDEVRLYAHQTERGELCDHSLTVDCEAIDSLTDPQRVRTLASLLLAAADELARAQGAPAPDNVRQLRAVGPVVTSDRASN